MELKFNGISKSYGRKEALKGVDINLSEGVYALLGPNGSGKTTLMNILAGVLRPSSGDVTLDGRDTVSMGNDFRRILGYLPQDPGFYPGFTVEELLKYFASLKGIKLSSGEVKEKLDFVNLYDERRTRYKALSGGMKRRLGIAIALAGDPKILILDEPTAGLDPKERVRFRNIISGIGRDKIIIYATHIVSDIESIADRVILLKKGEVIDLSTTAQMTASIEGSVWSCVMERDRAEEYVEQNPGALITSTGADTVTLKIISGERPLPDAVNARPTLEDVYMYHFLGGEQ